MTDDKSTPKDDATEDIFDKYDDGVIAADDTGMLSGERANDRADRARRADD